MLWRRFLGTLDVRAGLVGATLMATLVAWINLEHGALGASTAAAKQWVYTFFMGAWIVQLCAWIARRAGAAALVVGLAVLLPTLVTIGATFAVHSARGTPRPVASTLPVALISPPSFLGWALRTRRAAREGANPWDRLGPRGGP